MIYFYSRLTCMHTWNKVVPCSIRDFYNNILSIKCGVNVTENITVLQWTYKTQ